VPAPPPLRAITYTKCTFKDENTLGFYDPKTSVTTTTTFVRDVYRVFGVSSFGFETLYRVGEMDFRPAPSSTSSNSNRDYRVPNNVFYSRKRNYYFRRVLTYTSARARAFFHRPTRFAKLILFPLSLSLINTRRYVPNVSKARP